MCAMHWPAKITVILVIVGGCFLQSLNQHHLIYCFSH